MFDVGALLSIYSTPPFKIHSMAMSDAVKRTLRRLCYFKMTLLLLQVLQKSLPIPATLSQSIESIMNGSVG